jgi:large subunit ribosomal protein L3
MTLKRLKLMGRKRGMTQLFNEKGQAIVCTVLEVQPNVVVQVKTQDSDGYSAVQLGFEKVETKDPRTVENRVTKPLRGHFKKAGVEPCSHLLESHVDAPESYSTGQLLGVDQFEGIQFIDVSAKSKGKGYQGVMKRHNFAGGPAAHGSGFHRHAGSTGQRTSPGRCLPGTKMAGHLGDEWTTTQSLKVVAIDPQENVVVVEGAVPGPRNGLVHISSAIKKQKANKKK